MSKRGEQFWAALACVLIAGSLGAMTALQIDDSALRTPTCEACEKPPRFSIWADSEMLRPADPAAVIPTPITK